MRITSAKITVTKARLHHDVRKGTDIDIDDCCPLSRRLAQDEFVTRCRGIRQHCMHLNRFSRIYQINLSSKYIKIPKLILKASLHSTKVKIRNIKNKKNKIRILFFFKLSLK